jgi:pantetheine-phosphate adenylyltransferase
VIAIYPGSFDPITLGHLDIIERGCQLFEQLIVVVFRNPSKTALFSVEQRTHQIRQSTRHLTNLGLRAVSDFELELQMAHTNKTLAADIETLFLATSTEQSFLSSSVVKEIARFGGAIEHLVPQPVVLDIYQCFAKNQTSEALAPKPLVTGTLPTDHPETL